MTNTDRERTTALTHKTKDLMDVLLRERREILAKQLVANVETRLRWLESNPIEISQRQQSYQTNAPEQVSGGDELLKNQDREAMNEEARATDRWENEGGYFPAKRSKGLNV